MAQPFLHNVTSGHLEMEQAPFVPAIARCYLVILSVQFLCLKLDFEDVAVVAIANRV